MRKKKNFIPRWDRVSNYLVMNAAALRGEWRGLFPEAAALHVELGCGKGGFLAASARVHPDTLFIGMERSPEALLMAMEKAISEELANLFFVCGDAVLLDTFFASDEVDMLFINFCDPWPSRKRARRRLTYRDYLFRCQKVLKPGCPLRFKTDDASLFAFTLKELFATGAQVVFQSCDWHHDPEYPGDDHMTEYETRFSALGVPIRRLEAVWR